MHKLVSKLVLGSVLAAGTMLSSAHAAEDYKLGIVTFLSGGAAGPFGVPAKNGAEMLIDALNSGSMPAPYNKVGINGQKIVPVYVDEAGGATKQVAEYRNLVEREEVNSVVGYTSSGDCLAVPAVAEQLKTITVLADCGTPRVFEEADYKYVFRTSPTATMDNVGAARYVMEKIPNLKTVSGINQNYSYGHDSWGDFTSSLAQLKPSINVSTKQFPKIYAGQYGAEISALMVNPAQVIHTSMWGGDVEAFLLQGSARGLFEDQTVILTTGETALHEFADRFPEGAIVGARGPNSFFAEDSELKRWLETTYKERYNTTPSYAVYHMIQAIMGLKVATEKAATTDGKIPSNEAISKAFEYLEFTGPAGKVSMKIGKGHQAIQGTAYGRVTHKDGKVVFQDVVHYKAECVNPPEGVKSVDWIKGGFKGAQCD